MRCRVILSVMIALAALALLSGTSLAQPPFPAVYTGEVSVGGEPVPDGYMLSAKIGEWETESVTVTDGQYVLQIAPPESIYIGRTIEFYLDGVKAAETSIFRADTQVTLGLSFPELPAAGIPTIPLVTLALGIGGVISLGLGLLLWRWSRLTARAGA